MTGSIRASARRTWLALVGAAACLSLLQPAIAQAERPRYAAILIDAASGEVLYANAADERRHPASITKVMTLFLAFDALVAGRLRLSDPITISRHAASQRPSRLGLPAGRSLSLDDAIHIITIKSANDVAVALAERIGGSESGFAQLMTRKARALGMTNTTFTNATGLPDPGNVTTARDIATLSAALLKAHPSYYAYFGQQAFKYDRFSFTNHNHLLGKLTGLDGIKTGFTNDAGYTLAASALRGGSRLITVVLGEPSIAARNRDVTALLEAGFTVLDRRRAGEDTSVMFNLPTLNHPALRIASAVEQGSRSDLEIVRRRAEKAPVRTAAAETKGKGGKGRRAEAKSDTSRRSARAEKDHAGKAGKKDAERSAKAGAKSGTGKSAQAKSETATKDRGKAEKVAAKAKRKGRDEAETETAARGKSARAAKTATAKKAAGTKREREAAAEDRRRPDKREAKSVGKRES